MRTKLVVLVTVCATLVGVALVVVFSLTRDVSESERLEAEVRQHLHDGDFGLAVVRARALVTHSEQSPVDSLRLAVALDVLVEALWRHGKALEPEARAHATRSLDIRERLYGVDGGPVVRSLLSVSLTLVADEQLAPLQRAWTIAETQLDSFDLDAILVLRDLGFAYLEGRNYHAAQPYMSEALRRLQRGPESQPLVEATILNGLAVLDYELRRDLPSARLRYERIIELREAELGREHPLLAGTYNNLALVHRALGDAEAARRMFERAIELRERVDPELPLLASSLINLALLLMELDEWELAQSRLERALQISVKAHGENHIATGLALSHLGYVHHKNGEYQIAQDYYVRGLDALAATPGLAPVASAGPMLDYAMLRYTLGDVDSAAALCQRSLATRESTYGPDHPYVALSLLYEAQMLAHRGETRAAFEMALRVEGIGREHMKVTSQTLAEREALLFARTRTQGLQLALRLVASEALPTPNHSRAWDALVRSRALVLDEMARRSRSVAQAADSETRARAGAVAAARNRLADLAVRGAEGDLQRYESDVREARLEKERAERRLAEVSAAFRAQLAEGEYGLGDVQRSMPESSALVAYAIYEMPVTWGASSVAADSGHAPRPFGFDFEELVPHLIAFVMRRGEQPRAVDLGRMGEIVPVVASWAREASTGLMLTNRSESDAEAAYRARAAVLRQRVWDPVEPFVGSAQRVFVVPDGVLHQVNLAALPSGSDAYLVDSGQRFHYLASERDLVRPQIRERSGVGLLALGGPDYNDVGDEMVLAEMTPSLGSQMSVHRGPLYRDTKPCRSFEQLLFPALPGTEAEVRAIASIWGDRVAPQAKSPTASAMQQTLLLGQQASEGRFKREAPGKRVLHLATHGFFLGGLCEAKSAKTRGLEVTGAGPSARWLPSPIVSPLLQAGLALAGANRRSRADERQADGILTGEEIASLDLTGVELAVLSACDTGVGEMLAGEGVLGLRRAFQVAGARSLVMSLWSVADEPTRDWMTALYEALVQRQEGVADATHAASLHILQQRRADGASTHPFYWASFVSVGDWR